MPAAAERGTRCARQRALRPGRSSTSACRARMDSVCSEACASKARAMPVLMLTARDTLADKMRAFELGADDFLMKPFEQAELAARCRALIRRASQTPSGAVRLGRSDDRSEWSSAARGRAGGRADATRMAGARESRPQSRAHRHARSVCCRRSRVGIRSCRRTPSKRRCRGCARNSGDAAVIRTIRGLGYRLEEAASDAAHDDDTAATAAAAAAGAGAADAHRRLVDYWVGDTDHARCLRSGTGQYGVAAFAAQYPH